MERRQVFALLAGSLGSAQRLRATTAREPEDCSTSHNVWVEDALKRMLTIEPGMTRKQLRTVFTTEGGISTRTWRIYVSRDCPFFEVNVEFEPIGVSGDDGSPAGLGESDDDPISMISGPYLQLSIMD